MFSVCLFGASLCLITTETNKIQDWRISSRFMWKPVSYKCSWSALLCHCMKLVSNLFKSYLGSYSFILTFMKYWEIYHMSTVHLIFGKHFTERVFYTDPCQIPFFQFHTADKISNERKNTTQTWGCARAHTLTSITPWWMDVYCFFRSITRVMTMTVAMTIPPTIRPIIAPLLELTSSAKKTYHVRENRERKMLPKKKKENGRWHSTISW